MTISRKLRYAAGALLLLATVPVTGQVMWALAVLGAPPLLLLLTTFGIFALLMLGAVSLDEWWKRGQPEE